MKLTLIRKILILTFVMFCIIALCRIIGNKLPNDINLKAQELKEYCTKKGYNPHVGVLVDYSIHSGRNRFVIWSFDKNKPLVKSICAQGCGKGDNHGKNIFSNEPSSLCTSLGHYKIGSERTMMSIKDRPTVCH